MAVEVQRRIVEDQKDMQEYIRELNQWEDEINVADQQIKKEIKVTKELPPIRGTSEVPSQISEKEQASIAEKELGNTAFKRGKWEVAIRHYTKSLELWPNAPLVLSNRSQTHLKLKNWAEANKDASTAIKLSSSTNKEECNTTNVKAYFRRAQARRELKLYNQSKSDLQAILQFDPEHKEAKSELDAVNKCISLEIQQMEDKKGRKQLVIEEVDEDSDEDDAPAKPKPAAPTTTTNTDDTKRKIVPIQVVDDDEDDEEEKIVEKKPKPSPMKIEEIVEEEPKPPVKKVDTPIPKQQPQQKQPQPTQVPNRTKIVIEEVEDSDDEESSQPQTTSTAAPPVVNTKPTVEDPPTKPQEPPKPTPKESSAHSVKPNIESNVSTNPAVVTFQPPTTYFDFEKQWISLKDDPESLSRYILTIEPTSLKSLFGNNLSYPVLSSFFKLLDSDLPHKEPGFFSLRFLYNLSNVPRFPEMMLFLTNDERQLLNNIFARATKEGVAKDKIDKAKAKLSQWL